MKKTPLKRKKAGQKTSPGYPTADEIGQDQRHFLRVVAKGLLGVGVLGLAACDADAPTLVTQGDAALDVLDHDEWITGGIAPPPDTVEDVYDPDWNIQGGAPMPDTVEDLHEEDWALGGAPRPPDTIDTLEDVVDTDYQLGGVVAIDVQAPDTCTPEDVEGEFPPLMGDMPAPDVVTHQDTKDDETDSFPPLDGDMAYPEEP